MRWIPACLLLSALLSGCGTPAPDGYQGYLEADYAYVGAPVAGRLASLAVARGDVVSAGSALYALDGELERRQIDEAQARLRQAQAQRADLGLGRRPEEIRVIAARVREASSALGLAERELKRVGELQQRGLASTDALDRASATHTQAQARLASANAEQRSAELAGRTDALAAADAAVQAAQAVLAQADWRLAQTRITATGDARVADTLFQPGEWVPAGAPVLKLLPAQGPYVRFFVPLAELPHWQAGQAVSVSCPGCPDGLGAKVRFIADAPEYTPPVIYSEARADDLVYRVEAALDRASPLAPGLPVVVRRP